MHFLKVKGVGILLLHNHSTVLIAISSFHCKYACFFLLNLKAWNKYSLLDKSSGVACRIIFILETAEMLNVTLKSEPTEEENRITSISVESYEENLFL